MTISLRRSHVGTIAAAIVLGSSVVTANLAVASHPEESLTGSSFEIDTDANIKVDDGAGSFDWANVTENRKQDSPTGRGDESFGQGTKEDTAVPTIVSGSIPPNKSDLKWFGVHQEGTTGSGFLNMFWSRVQDPTGTTNMDFELNKRYCDPEAAADADCSSNGVTPIRSLGDLLITYDLSNGGTVPTLSFREWSGSAWGTAQDLSQTDDAAGSINNINAIPAGESDGLGAHSLRTFGEAQVRLSRLLGSTTPTEPSDCRSFGSVYLKSRSSDSFTSAVKDFVPPTAANITNCGSAKVIKKAGSTGGPALAGAGFTLYVDDAPTGGSRDAGDTTTFADWTCTTGADGECTMVNVPPGSYWLVETTVPQGYDPVADQLVTVSGTALTTVGPLADPVATRTTSLTSAQRFVPNDTATVEVADDQGALAGDIRFRLYNNSTCTGTPLYDSGDIDITTGTANNSGGKLRRTLSSSNTTAYTTTGPATLYWLVTYISDNPNHTNIDGGCGIERTTIDIDNNFVG